MIWDMLGYYKMIKDNNITILYSGPIWADGIEGIGGTVRKRMEFDELPLPATQRVFSVFVEQMNNMLMYSTEKECFPASENRQDSAAKGIFVLGVSGKTYFIQSGNLMKSENVEPLKKTIDHLNTLDKAELRKYHKEQIRNENINPESRGAGLGIIEIARRADSRIEYAFTPMEEGMTFFSMYVTIG